jgi:hypothetical protein
MSYIFKFENNDVFVNSVKAYPEVQFYIYEGTAYYNLESPTAGGGTRGTADETRDPTPGSPMPRVPLYSPTGSYTDGAVEPGPRPGYLSLYEENVDRNGNSGLTSTTGASLTPFENAVKQSSLGNLTLPEDSYTGLNPRIEPFVVKNGDRLGFSTVGLASFNATTVGAIMANSYPLTASISKEFYEGYGAGAAARYKLADVSEGTGGGYTVEDNGAVSHLFALQTAMNSYKNLSPRFAYSSSQLPPPDLSGLSATADFRTLGPGATTVPVGLLSVPSIFYGSAIKKGSVNLRTYVSGTLVGELKDLRHNGELIQVGPTGSVGTGSVAGVVLYNEGFIVLTGSWPLAPDQAAALAAGTWDPNATATSPWADPYDYAVFKENYAGSGSDNPRWTYFAQGITSGSSKSDRELDGWQPVGAISTQSSSYYLRFQGTTKTPVLTMMAHAKKNNLNHSNNPTFVEYNKPRLFTTGSRGYIENDELPIKNTVSSSYNTPTGSFKKTTYITKIGIYDEQKNLIGIASLANPVKKTEDRNFTFKLKLDI